VQTCFLVVCLSVCLLAGLHGKLQTDFNEISWTDWSSAKDVPLNGFGIDTNQDLFYESMIRIWIRIQNLSLSRIMQKLQTDLYGRTDHVLLTNLLGLGGDADHLSRSGSESRNLSVSGITQNDMD